MSRINLQSRVFNGLHDVPAQAWVLLLTAACLVPFVNRSFFVDDTLFLRTARQIQKHPVDFYGFNIRWFYAESPMIENTYNPPLAGYYLAAAAAVVGWREWSLHLAFLVPALAAAWGTFALARRFCRQPGLATAAAILTPVFLISATTLMCDVMLLAFWVWSLVCFTAGLERNNWRAFVAAGALAGLAFLTKFTGLGLVPLMAAYGLIRVRRAGWWVLAPLLPLLFVAGYEGLTWRLYGHGHLLQAAVYAHGENVHRGLVDKLAIGLSFTGGCFLPLMFYLPLSWAGQFRRQESQDSVGKPFPRAWASVALTLAVMLAGLMVLPRLTAFKTFLRPNGTTDWGLSIQAAMFCGAGILLFWLAILDYWRRRDADSILLGFWVLGVFAFVTLINWTVNGRSLLPMAPALAMLLVRRLEAAMTARSAGLPSESGAAMPQGPLPSDSLTAFGPGHLWGMLAAGIAAAGLSLALVKSDCNVTRAERDVTTELYRKYQRPGRTVWFEGHGGFQYYLEEMGAKPLDMSRPEIGPDDVVIIPNCAPGVSTPNLNVVGVVDAVKYQPNRYVSTAEPSLAAAFYEAVRGPLPFAVGRPKPDYCFVFARKTQ